MKKLIVICLLLGAGNSLFSQTNEELELFRDIFQLEKAALFAEFIDLPQEKLEVLSPIYSAYEGDRRALGDRRVNMLKTYAAQYEKISDSEADALVKEYFSLRKDTQKLRKKYYKQVKKNFGSRIALSFLQFEEYIENAIQKEIWEEIPFVE